MNYKIFMHCCILLAGTQQEEQSEVIVRVRNVNNWCGNTSVCAPSTHSFMLSRLSQ